MRAVKSPAELALIKQAVAATVAGYEAALRFIRPGVTERADRRHPYRRLPRARRRTGLRAHRRRRRQRHGAPLHRLDQVVNDGDLIVIDYAAAYGGYASDVTRTLPATGVFTPEQRELYEIVLEANLAGIEAARPGATITDVQNAALRSHRRGRLRGLLHPRHRPPARHRGPRRHPRTDPWSPGWS